MVVTQDNAHEVLMSLRRFYMKDYAQGDDDEYFVKWIEAWIVSHKEEIRRVIYGPREGI